MNANIKIQNNDYNKVTYVCHKCKTLVNLKINSKVDNIKCEHCNGRIFFKLRTKNVCQYQCI